MTILHLRGTGWTKIPADQLSNFYSILNDKLSSPDEKIILKYKKNEAFPTEAAEFGAYVQELYAVYTCILKDMKTSREWIALKVRSTYHSKANYVDSIIISDETDDDQVQLQGMKFDPLVFNFPWVDNTRDNPWTPWGWEMDILSNDLDETHYFFDLKSNKLIIGTLNGTEEIYFYNMRPDFPKNLQHFILE
jgi:hypothetical protein